jgi:hypothetical protein
MIRRSVATLAGVFALATWVIAQKPDIIPSVDLVELDVSVVDDKGRPVSGLGQQDFTVTEDGRAIALTTFDEVGPDRLTHEQASRSVVLLLDDVAVPPAGSAVIQSIARAVVSSVSRRDEISVVRLNNRGDQPYGDRRLAELRIAEYRAGAVPYVEGMTLQDTLNRIGDLSKQLETTEPRRKIIICVGSPVVCNIAEPSPTAPPPALWPSWVGMLSASARSNVGVYTIVPARIGMSGGGLAQYTGGEVFATNYDVGPAIDRILQDANHYYMLGYWPPEGKVRELHSINVKVGPRGFKIKVRRQRGA